MDEKDGLKVVMVLSNAQASAGGTQRQAISLANQLESQGLSVSIVSKSEGVKGEINKNVKFIRLPRLRLLPGSFFFSFIIWAAINRKRFQIIHAHNASLGVVSSLVGWLLRKKVVIKIPGMKYVDYLNGVSISRQLRRWILTRKANRFIAVSTDMVQALQNVGIAPEKIALIPNGVGLTTLNHNRTALKPKLLGNAELKVVLFVGRLVEDKGLDRLITVWASMPSHDRAALLIVGDGPLRKDLESQAKGLRLLPSVGFLGHQRDVSAFYSMADLFVLPSRTEGVSNSLLEAMASGLPVVASDVGGNRDIIEHGQSGLLVDWENIPACVQVLSTLLSEAGLRSRIGSAARARAKCFEMGDVAEHYLRLYEAVLEE